MRCDDVTEFYDFCDFFVVSYQRFFVLNRRSYCKMMMMWEMGKASDELALWSCVFISPENIIKRATQRKFLGAQPHSFVWKFWQTILWCINPKVLQLNAQTPQHEFKINIHAVLHNLTSQKGEFETESYTKHTRTRIAFQLNLENLILSNAQNIILQRLKN